MNITYERSLKMEEERQMAKAIDWYEDYIEEPIRDLVRLLRNNGFNTECSCGHEMNVQCQYIPEGEIQRLHNLLFNKGYRNYKIEVRLFVLDGFSYPSLQITILGK